uniref:WRKY family protein 10 n=1 Tax=Heracleum moellendorffii TaxID=99507 RepID=A0A9E9BRA4_9APIA|nr:WRKY family protein 10 [Heracleum moellendorffii]
MDEDTIQPPPPPPPPFLTENIITSDNNDDIFPYFLNSSLLFPLTSQNQYYPTSGPLVTQNSQFAVENIDWINTMLNGKPMENRDQMPPSPCVPVLASIPPRVAFHTRSSEDILDDGYKWRKYGQKSVHMECSTETLQNRCKDSLFKLKFLWLGLSIS